MLGLVGTEKEWYWGHATEGVDNAKGQRGRQFTRGRNLLGEMLGLLLWHR